VRDPRGVDRCHAPAGGPVQGGGPDHRGRGLDRLGDAGLRRRGRPALRFEPRVSGDPLCLHRAESGDRRHPGQRHRGRCDPARGDAGVLDRLPDLEQPGIRLQPHRRRADLLLLPAVCGVRPDRRHDHPPAAQPDRGILVLAARHLGLFARRDLLPRPQHPLKETPMALATLYNTGTISVGAGSTTVTGSGTAWNTSGTQAGDDFRAAGLIVPIASIDSATQITLARAWPGATLAGANYDVRQIDDGLRTLAAANQLNQALGAGTLTSLAALASGANQMPYWTGAGVMAMTPISAAARALMDDADAAAMRSTLGLVPTSSATDATAGRLLKHADWGIGAEYGPNAANLNTTLRNGWYSFSSGSTGVAV